MGDGSFYEGQFINGEIQGHGFRRWASTKNEYTGQFVKGELNGYGIMVYSDGFIYEGEWMANQREGTELSSFCIMKLANTSLTVTTTKGCHTHAL